MLTFLFWNINRKPLQESIARLCTRHAIDILILAECEVTPLVMLRTLNRGTENPYDFPFSECQKIAIYTRLPREFITPKLESISLTIRNISLPGSADILLAATHLPSKLHWSRESQAANCAELSHLIRQAEQDVGHSRTVLVGDLNMNPFEDGVIAANGLHAVMTRRLADKRSRIVQGQEYPFFYNPMWGHFGDTNQKPPGTYYDYRSEPISLFWNLFDQVVIRPDLMPFFHNEELEILTDDGEIAFLSEAAVPDNSVVSDHLPILFRMNI